MMYPPDFGKKSFEAGSKPVTTETAMKDGINEPLSDEKNREDCESNTHPEVNKCEETSSNDISQPLDEAENSITTSDNDKSNSKSTISLDTAKVTNRKEPAQEQDMIQQNGSQSNSKDGGILSLITNKKLVIFLTGFFLQNYGHISTFAFIPSLAKEVGLTRTHASVLVSIIAACNIVGRPTAGFLSDCPQCSVRRQLIYGAFCSVYGVFVVLLTQCMSFQLMIVDVIFIGITACKCIVLFW
jgi:hypothetical protein